MSAELRPFNWGSTKPGPRNNDVKCRNGETHDQQNGVTLPPPSNDGQLVRTHYVFPPSTSPVTTPHSRCDTEESDCAWKYLDDVAVECREQLPSLPNVEFICASIHLPARPKDPRPGRQLEARQWTHEKSQPRLRPTVDDNNCQCH